MTYNYQTSEPSPPTHGLHLVLTLLTAGVWLPFWLFDVYSYNRRKTDYYRYLQLNPDAAKRPPTPVRNTSIWRPL
jgi:hypothetical protein